MKTFLKVSAVIVGLFIFIPLVYGIGDVFINVWRDMLPYSWTHNVIGHHHNY